MPGCMPMGMAFGLQSNNVSVKRKFRWLFKIPQISAHGVHSLPPEKAGRPGLTFKDIAAEHLNETIYMPGKPDWKQITLVLYDLKRNQNPVFEWVKRIYDTCQNGNGAFKPFYDTNFKVDSTLTEYDGCGQELETWELDNVWPQQVDWGELNMQESGYLTVSLTLRYDRARIVQSC